MSLTYPSTQAVSLHPSIHPSHHPFNTHLLSAFMTLHTIHRLTTPRYKVCSTLHHLTLASLFNPISHFSSSLTLFQTHGPVLQTHQIPCACCFLFLDSSFSRPALFSMVATSHIGLSKFKLIKMKFKIPFFSHTSHI